MSDQIEVIDPELLYERRLAWIEGLRSDEWGQAREQLGRIAQVSGDPKGRDRLCCLGAACVVANKLGLDLEILTRNGDYLFDGEMGLLPPSVAAFYGLSEQNPRVISQGSKISFGDVTLIAANNISAADLNDQLKLSFEQIADLLEQSFDIDEQDEGLTHIPTHPREFQVY